MQPDNPLTARVNGADHREVAGVQLDTARAGSGRVKRAIYPPGFRWSTHMKPLVNTDLCMHAHVGFLVQGHIRIDYPDGCTLDLSAPHAVVIEPGHDGRVVGDEPAILIEFDFEGETAERFGLPAVHGH